MGFYSGGLVFGDDAIVVCKDYQEMLAGFIAVK
jgi:hypothetical protein